MVDNANASWSEGDDLRVNRSGRKPNMNMNFGANDAKPERVKPVSGASDLGYVQRTPVSNGNGGNTPKGATAPVEEFGGLYSRPSDSGNTVTPPVRKQAQLPVAGGTSVPPRGVLPSSGAAPVAPGAPTRVRRSEGLPVAGAGNVPPRARELPVAPPVAPPVALPVTPHVVEPPVVSPVVDVEEEPVVVPVEEPVVVESAPPVKEPAPRVKKGRPAKGESAPNVQGALAKIDDGWDEDNPAFEDMEGDVSEYTFSSRNLRITPRDVDMIRFLARFRYAQGVQLARYVGASRKSVDQRLVKLGKAGLIRREDITRGQGVWTPTAMGYAVADMDFSSIGTGKISPVTLGHTLGLVNLAIDLEMGYQNVLGLDDFGGLNRIDTSGNLVPGEMLVSEREIRQSMQRWKSVMPRKDMEEALRRGLVEWRELGDPDIPSPELEVGNEAMFVLWATRAGRSDHIPDLVVTKPRKLDGSPGSIAVELELSTKPMNDWVRIMQTFAEDNSVYDQVHYFTHRKDVAKGLTNAAERAGLVAQERFVVHSYKPVQGGLPFWG